MASIGNELAGETEEALLDPNHDDEADAKKAKETESQKNKKKEEEIFVHEDDAFFKKWAGPIIVGPFLPAVFAVIVIFSGQIVMNTWEGTCGYDLGSFIGAAVAICYLFLIVYSWVFLGDTIRLKSKTIGIDITVLTPFRSFRWVVVLYFVVAVASFIVWIVGTVLLQLSVFCEATAPTLYNYSVFLVASYWLGFSITVIYTIKLFFGSNIAAMIKESTRPATLEEVEEKIFRAKFQEYDREKEGKIKTEDLPPLLEALGVFVPEEEVETLQNTLDPEDSGYISYDDMRSWFRTLNAELDARAEEDGDDDDLDAEEAAVAADFEAKSWRFSSKKQA